MRVEKRIRAPSSAARSARSGSARSWLTRPVGAGEKRLKSGMASVKLWSTRPVTLAAMTMVISGRPGGAAATNPSSRPAARSASMVAGI